MLLSGVGRRKLNILWALKHPFLLGCFFYIIFQLIDETQCSSKPDRNLNPAKVKKTGLHLTDGAIGKSETHTGKASEWFRDYLNRNQSNEDTDKSMLISLNSKVDEISETLKKLIQSLKPDNRSDCNGSKILDNSSESIAFTLNNISISNSMAKSTKDETTTELTEISFQEGDQPERISETLTSLMETSATTVRLDKVSQNESSDMSETSTSQIGDETSATTVRPNNVSLNESSDNISDTYNLINDELSTTTDRLNDVGLSESSDKTSDTYSLISNDTSITTDRLNNISRSESSDNTSGTYSLISSETTIATDRLNNIGLNESSDNTYDTYSLINNESSITTDRIDNIGLSELSDNTSDTYSPINNESSITSDMLNNVGLSELSDNTYDTYSLISNETSITTDRLNNIGLNESYDNISETSTSLSDETIATTVQLNNVVLNESSVNTDTSTDSYDYPTAPRSDDSNISVPTISRTMAEVPDLGENEEDFDNEVANQSASRNAQARNSQVDHSQQDPESYGTNEEPSSTPIYESSQTYSPISKSIAKSVSFTTNTSSSSQIANLDPGYRLKRIVLQGVDKIHFSPDDHSIQLPPNEADIYLFYYIPGAMNLHRAGDNLYLPTEHKHLEVGSHKHQYTSGRSSDDYSAHSLHFYKLMHSYAKAKQQIKSASKAQTTSLQKLNQTSNTSVVNHTTAAEQHPKNENSPTYYFVAPYFASNHSFGDFQLSHPMSSSAQVQTNRTARAVKDELPVQVSAVKRKERETIYENNPFILGSAAEVKCSDDMKSCADKSDCIPKERWCNRIVDCADKSDELHCTCKERMDSLKLCDHYFDCPDGEDERGCFGCPEDGFSCGHSLQRPNGTCIPRSKRCNGIVDCPDGLDELNCELLLDTVDSHETVQTSYTTGYLHRNFMGRWYPACIDIHEEHVWGIQACKAELLVNVRHVEVEFLPFHGNYAGKFITHGKTESIYFVDSCKFPGYAIHVKCPSMPCGSRIIQRNSPPPSRYLSKRHAPTDPKKEPVYKAIEFLVGKDVVESLRREKSSRVVHGTVAKQGDWPWLVALYRNGELHCGGTIIDETWVLTAGHCVYEYRSHFYEVYAGMLRRFSFSPNEQLRTVTHVIVHPEYSHKDWKNDLALLKLNEPLKFNRWVRPTCLPVDRPPWGPLAGARCTAAGWGSLWEDERDYPDSLREVNLPIRASCKDLADLEGEEICAGYEEGGRDTCQGDSGGPLLCKLPRVHDVSYIAGVVSHGEGCARPHEPGAYTRVALYIPWIITHTDHKFLTPARQSSQKCPSMRCSYEGRCLGVSRLCDRIVDCLSAEDEIDCSLPMLNSEDEESKLIKDYYELNKRLDEIRILDYMTNNNRTAFPPSRQKSNNSSQSRNIQNLQSMSLVEESTEGMPNASSNSGSSLNDEPFIEKRETTSYFTCQNLHQNIPLEFYCDTEVDCEDGTDEINCSCADYLKATNKSLICDGIIHCHDLSDEKYCPDYNCTNDEFFCFKSRSCISKNLVCDGKKHCSHGEDENRCYWPIPIATSTPIQNQFDMFGVPLFSDQGVIAYNDHTVWKWSCFPQEREVDVPKTVEKLAKRLGFKNYTSYDHFLVYDDEVLNRRQQKYCPGLLVDFSTAQVDDESLIPWRVSIFVDGILTCLGVLVKEQWVLTDESCCLKLNTSTDYIVAAFGRDEKLSPKIRAYEEQIILVDKIRCDKRANTTLMHLHKKTKTTEKTKSLEIVSTKEMLGLKKNFLLILEDTRSAIFELMVISNCSVASSCYRMKYDTQFCLNSNSTLQFASVISLSKKKQWIFSGIVVESLTCLNNETVVKINLPQTPSNTENKFENITEFYYRGHRVFRCTQGNKISWENVCDGKVDCREKEDEIDLACQEKKLLIKGGFQKPSCRMDQLKCNNGRCVSKSTICNSINDCGDNTDEPETCSKFNCAAYLNLTNPKKLCNSQQDCEDKSDENIETCPSLCNSPSSFRCQKSNSCIPLDFVCDGERDCESGEDEEQCISYRVTDHNGTEGAIWMQTHGKWKQHCFTPGEMVAFDAQHLCKLFGYSLATSNRSAPATSHIYTHSTRVKLNNFVEVTLGRNAEKQFDSKEYCEHLYLTCR